MKLMINIDLKIPDVPRSFFDKQGREYLLDELTEDDIKAIGNKWI
jgi:hypothetical protein